MIGRYTQLRICSISMHYFVFIVVQIQATRGATLRNVLELTNKTMQSNEIVYFALGQ